MSRFNLSSSVKVIDDGFGSLSKHANHELRQKENLAWDLAMKEKYQKNYLKHSLKKINKKHGVVLKRLGE